MTTKRAVVVLPCSAAYVNLAVELARADVGRQGTVIVSVPDGIVPRPVVPDGVDVRLTRWRDSDATTAKIAVQFAGVTWQPRLDEYLLPDDGVAGLTDVDRWLLVSEDVGAGLVPLRPYDMVYTGALPHLRGPRRAAALEALRGADRILVEVADDAPVLARMVGRSVDHVVAVPPVALAAAPVAGGGSGVAIVADTDNRALVRPLLDAAVRYRIRGGAARVVVFVDRRDAEEGDDVVSDHQADLDELGIACRPVRDGVGAPLDAFEVVAFAVGHRDAARHAALAHGQPRTVLLPAGSFAVRLLALHGIDAATLAPDVDGVARQLAGEHAVAEPFGSVDPGLAVWHDALGNGVR